MKLQCGKTVSG
ncbi:MAG: hypothetical protein EZS28_047731, partial [Streblomastix strix]